jgi:hypothetical protein
MVNSFYNYMADVYLDYNNNEEQKTKQPFHDYFLYKLYFDYGIKRKYLYSLTQTVQQSQDIKPMEDDTQVIKSNIVLLYYVKTLKGYKPKEPITQLCRHLILDTNNMKILSLGIPKGIDLDTFLQKYEINSNDIKTSFAVNQNGQYDSIKYRIYKFPEGTMITYNPTLKQILGGSITEHSNEQDDAMEDKSIEAQNILAEENITKKYYEYLQYSTRRKIGTGSFNTKKTFAQMFEENNVISNTHLDNIPEEIMHNLVLVFNLEHLENIIINQNTRNFNTLCAVYKLKDEQQANLEWSNIKSVMNVNDQVNEIKSLFKTLGTDMVTSIHVSKFKKQVMSYDINLHLPEVITSFEKRDSDNEKIIVPVDQVTFDQLIQIVQTKPNTFQGYLLYGINGERSKIMNSKYKSIKELKGSRPITLQPWNTKNLFHTYWKLIKENKVNEFITTFETPDLKQDVNNYTNLFTWFANCVHNYSVCLFNTYQAAFVKKQLIKSNIPYMMKPQCGDLHTKYLENKTPVNPVVVSNYVYNLPFGKIFWRVFNSPAHQPPQQK